MRYRIEVDSPRHKAHGWFVAFTVDANGRTSAQIEEDPHRATSMGLDVARIALRRLQEPKFRIRCRIIDDFGNAHTGFEDGQALSGELNIHNYTETSVWRDRFEGRSLELPLLHNKAVGKWYLKLSTSANPDDPPDISVAGSTPQEVFERFTSNPHWQQYHGRFVVEEMHALPVTEPAASGRVVQIDVPSGQQVVSVAWRPGSIR